MGECDKIIMSVMRNIIRFTVSIFEVDRKEIIMGVTKKNNTSNKKLKEGRTVPLKNSLGFKLPMIITVIFAIALSTIAAIAFISSAEKSKNENEDKLAWKASYLLATFQGVKNQYFTAAGSTAEVKFIAEHLSGDDKAARGQGNGNDDGKGGEGQGGEEQQNMNTMIVDSLNAKVAGLKTCDCAYIVDVSGKTVAATAETYPDVSSFEATAGALSGVYCASPAHVSSATGNFVISFFAPIVNNDAIVGAVGMDYQLEKFHDILADTREEDKEDALLIDNAGIVAAHSEHLIKGTDDIEDRTKSTMYTSGKDSGYYESDTGKGFSAYISYAKDEDTGFIVAANAFSDKVLEKSRAVGWTIVGISIAALIIGVGIVIVLCRNIIAPVTEIEKSLSMLANGEFKVIGGYTNRKDEFGVMIRNTNSLISKLRDIVSHIKESAGRVGASSTDLSDMAEQITNTADEVTNTVQGIASGAVEQANEIQKAAENFGSISNTVNGVQDSATELSTIAHGMREASQMSSDALGNLKASSEDMSFKIDDISSAISETQGAVATINEKVEQIASIASQTNLLSLNASIEAARAGEAGKGFAVVAEEIGKLADSSRQMANDIRVEMDNLLSKSDAAVSAAGEVKEGNEEQNEALDKTLASISDMLQDIGKTVDGISAISKGAESCVNASNGVNDAMHSLSAISEENAAISEETGASMEELSSTVATLAKNSHDLKAVSDELRQQMEFFKE